MKRYIAVDSLEKQTIPKENSDSEEISITSISTKVLESALNKLKEHYSLVIKLFYKEFLDKKLDLRKCQY